MCKAPVKGIKINYYPEIKRKIETFSSSNWLLHHLFMIFITGIVNKVGNHATVLIGDNQKLYIYDPTNLCVLNVVDDKNASIINGNGNFELKLFTTLLLYKDLDQYQLFEKLLSDQIEPAFTRKEIIFSFEDTIELIKNNISLLDDAYDNIHSELEIIDKQTDEINGSFKRLKR